MGSHCPLPTKEFLNLLGTELKYLSQLKDYPRPMIATIHLYVEYWINEIVRMSFPQSKLILDGDLRIFSFKTKVTILTALNVITDKHLVKNLDCINNLRNLAVHSLMLKPMWPKIVKKISEMKEIKTFELPLEYNLKTDRPMVKFQVCALSTIIALNNTCKNIVANRTKN